MTIEAYLGLGSNLDRPMQQIHRALESIAALPGVSATNCAPWYRSVALGPSFQADYINTVARIKTCYTPLRLLEVLQHIERQQGRKRTRHWGPRTLDIDILLYGNRTFRNRRLRIPHPRLREREFVLRPLSDIAPTLPLGNSQTPADLLASLEGAGMVRVDAGDTSGNTGYKA